MIGMTRNEYIRLFPRLGISHDVRDMAHYPMLFERTERVCTETNPSHGGCTTARDLARFYSILIAQLHDDRSDALPAAETLEQFCTDARPQIYDAVLGRVCAYGLGFMTSLEQHAFGTAPSPASFGHFGNVGASFAFAIATTVAPLNVQGITHGFSRRLLQVLGVLKRPSECGRSKE